MTPLSFREILRFYFPLVLNSQMMTLSGPIINLAVGRASDAKLELAAYWIGFTILLFIESPCLTIQQPIVTAFGCWSARRFPKQSHPLIWVVYCLKELCRW